MLNQNIVQESFVQQKDFFFSIFYIFKWILSTRTFLENNTLLHDSMVQTLSFSDKKKIKGGIISRRYREKLLIVVNVEIYYLH